MSMMEKMIQSAEQVNTNKVKRFPEPPMFKSESSDNTSDTTQSSNTDVNVPFNGCIR